MQLIDYHCRYCKKAFTDYKSPYEKERIYCSKECFYAARKGTPKPRKVPAPRITRACAHCGVEYTLIGAHAQDRRCCSQACKEADAATRRVVYNCIQCGNPCTRPKSRMRAKGASFCSRRCHQTYQAGNRHPKWVGGTSDFRGPNWKVQRAKALKRDKNTCQHCGAAGDLAVHHIVPYRVTHDNALKNLITLCNSCHGKADNLYRRLHPVFQLQLF